MIAIRLAEAAGDTDRDQLSSDIFAERYLIKRPLLQALEPDVAGAPAAAIDELDAPTRRSRPICSRSSATSR